MLVLSREDKEWIQIQVKGEIIKIMVVGIKRGQVRLGIAVDREHRVMRGELVGERYVTPYELGFNDGRERR